MRAKKVSKVTVVHPVDYTTDILGGITAALEQETELCLVREAGSQAEARDICNSKRDVFFALGHGTPMGLMAMGRFGEKCSFVVDESFVPAMRQHKACFLLWCHCDQFMLRLPKLRHSFFCGMFVSDTDEAWMNDLPKDQRMVDESNEEFVKIVCKFLPLLLVCQFLSQRFIRLTSNLGIFLLGGSSRSIS